MNTGPNPLQERIEGALREHAFVQHSPGAGEHVDLSPQAAKYLAARIAPIIAAEVRKAQADAWGEGQASGWSEAQEQWQINGAVGDMWKHADTPNPYREQED